MTIFIIIEIATVIAIGIFVLIFLHAKNENKKLLENGVELWATVKKVDFAREYDSNGKVCSIQYEVTYEFDYRGLKEKTLNHSIYAHPEKYKEGNKVLCIYDPDKDIFDTEEEIQKNSKGSILPVILFSIFIVVIAIFPMIIYITFTNYQNITVVFNNYTNLFDDYILHITFGCVFAILLFALYLSIHSHIIDKDYTVINSEIIELLYHQIDNDHRNNYSYTPVVEFYYNGKTYIYILGWLPYTLITPKKYLENNQLEIKFNPETLSVK